MQPEHPGALALALQNRGEPHTYVPACPAPSHTRDHARDLPWKTGRKKRSLSKA